MSDQTKEYAFETRVEEVLLGPAGWHPGNLAEWDVERALFPALWRSKSCRIFRGERAIPSMER